MRTNKYSLRLLRQAKYIKQVTIAVGLGIAINTYSQYETGKRQMPITLIPKLAKILNCSIEDIVMCFCDEEDLKGETK